MSGSSSQGYISHHLHFLQVDLRDLSVVDSVKPVSSQEFDACVSNGSTHEQCLTTVAVEKCKLFDLGSGVCYSSHSSNKESQIVNPYTLNLDSLGISLVLG